MITVGFDLTPLFKIQAIPDRAKQVVREEIKALVDATYVHIKEKAQERLHTRREMFIEHCHQVVIDDDTHMIFVEAKYRWIEDGLSEHNMLMDLLGSKKAKRAKDGSTYVVVPFKHGPKGVTEATPAQMDLLTTIKAEMKKKKIPYGGIEKDASGQAKLGLLHSFDIMTAPLKTLAPYGGAGQGRGAVGKPMVGPTGIPLLKGVRIYQNEVKNATTGKKSVQKSIMTFRIASSKHLGQGRWDHPGLESCNFLEEGKEWALKEWNDTIEPQIIRRLLEINAI